MMRNVENKNKNKNRYMLRAGMAIVLAAGVGLSTMPAGVSAEQPALSLHNWGQNQLSAPIVKPAWTIDVDSRNDRDTLIQNQAKAEDGKVFAFAGGKLIAVDAASGKKLWSYGNKLIPIVIYHGGSVIGQTKEGRVFSLNAKNGKQQWISSAAYGTADSIVAMGHKAYVLLGNKMTALALGSGKYLWTAEEPNSSGGGSAPIVADGVVIRSFLVQGALTSVQIDGFDDTTGKKLWSHFRQDMPLQIKGGLLYSVQDPYPFADDTPERSVKISVINVKSGAVKGERVYSWKLPGGPPYTQSGINGGAFLDGDALYIHQGLVIAQYDFADYKAGGAPVQKWNKPYGEVGSLQRIHQGRMLFQDYKTGDLVGMKLVTGQQVGWTGDNPAKRIEVYGNGIYRAQSDGMFHAFDVMTTKAVFSVKTGSRDYGATLKTGGNLIIQAEGKLIGIKLPAALK
ncbi:PQQ-binding-like beta-propeller repeat protein [Paenibacillus oenotherae]|uniref:PQQ-binding-like beta-propeller repeat protein n=1 Tax=Paenibacillus oenotherae TaxID=1435645 RepID=A0ABS7D2X1_9BACL|nr:PQQ-binding-like beta-propeller repeat protein [Paenibacillus oenotherae]MBW7474280.1 PQQ-binding-like beta-propeller repeat protein [Paenibacillus oenotherae]